MMQSDFDRKLAKMQFGSSTRAKIYKKLAKLIKNKVQVRDALEIIRKLATRGGKRNTDPIPVAISEWVRRLKTGDTLANAMGDWVPFEDKMLIQAGEEAGNLEFGLLSVIAANKARSEIISNIVKGLAYPIVIFLVAMGILLMYGYKVIPEFTRMSDPEGWTGMAKGLYYVSWFIQNIFPYVAVVILIICGIIIYTLPLWTGRIRTRFDSLPPWSIYKMLQGSGFVLSMAALTKAKVPIKDSLAKLRKGASPWLKERIDAAFIGLKSGVNLGQALEKAGHKFPDQEVIDDISIYADLNDFDEAMRIVGEEWMEESVEKIKKSVAVLNIVAMLSMGLIVGFIAIGTTALNQQLASSAQQAKTKVVNIQK